MPALVPFHEIRFPTGISLGASGGPERRTEIVALASGHEERNTRWADSRRRYDAGYGVRSLDDLHAVIAFFEERRGRLYGFRWHDRADCRSCAPGGTPAATDQVIGTGDGERTEFQLTRTYGSSFAPWVRAIRKPVAGSVSVAVAGVAVADGWTCDPATGVVTFADPPAEGAEISAGFSFDVPVRFDTDRLAINLTSFAAGDIPSIPLVELRI